MPNPDDVKLKGFSQARLLGPGGGPAAEGVCYYMCHYLEINDWKKTTYEDALSKAGEFAAGGKMINYAKSVNLKYDQQANEGDKPNSLAFNRLYRLSVGIDNDHRPNHAIAVLTGAKTEEIIFMDPNNGFYQPTAQNLNNRQALEYWISALYSETVTFHAFLNVGAVNSEKKHGWALLPKH